MVGLAGLPAVGPPCAEAIGKQHLLDAGQIRQMHSSTKDSSGPLQAPSKQPGWGIGRRLCGDA